MNVLVAGGTGFIGRNLCTELVDRGHDVTALSRDPDPSELPEGVETAVGDLSAYDSIEGAFEGQDVVVNLVALSPLFKPPKGVTHMTVHYGGTENVLQAMDEHGVDRLVHMSALGADPDGLTEYIRAKGLAEEAVREADVDSVIFQPSVVFGDGGEFVPFARKLTPGPLFKVLPGGGKTRFQPIHVDDLVPMLADAVEDDAHTGEIYEIGGPDVLTLAEVTRLAYEAEGKSAKIVPLPMTLAKIGLTFAGPVPFIPMGPDQARSLRLDNTTTDNGVTAFGADPDSLTTLQQYLGLS
ncbi:complex I NDUFA9 subunit family protein [Natranaeroarchaeum aerophilus]|uniref:Complex I NDUFA9 subunit family protein n=1 Tax=Natranaeroarchaeum aerophilus TaxID=2917711 RepID=A0AAE3FT29_9EURY|nr:complex I NDUFA9 subunit family protein [Natranaeroarchaeum aerophilus]MCL9814823.1 complex I NDUFA9 subunit family protein [Natranaeroarchaeum aerophilus]